MMIDSEVLRRSLLVRLEAALSDARLRDTTRHTDAASPPGMFSAVAQAELAVRCAHALGRAQQAESLLAWLNAEELAATRAPR